MPRVWIRTRQKAESWNLRVPQPRLPGGKGAGARKGQMAKR